MNCSSSCSTKSQLTTLMSQSRLCVTFAILYQLLLLVPHKTAQCMDLCVWVCPSLFPPSWPKSTGLFTLSFYLTELIVTTTTSWLNPLPFISRPDFPCSKQPKSKDILRGKQRLAAGDLPGFPPPGLSCHLANTWSHLDLGLGIGQHRATPACQPAF